MDIFEAEMARRFVVAVEKIANALDCKDEPQSEKRVGNKATLTINNGVAKVEPQTIRCPKCGRTDYIRDMEKDMGIKGSHYKYKCINCNTYIKDEPQADCSWK